MLKCQKPFAFVAAIIALCAASSAWADYTTVFNPPPNEQSHQQIFNRLYGGNFVAGPEGSFSFTNGSIYAERIEDQLFGTESDEPLDMASTGGDGTDQFWNANFTFASAEAKFAAYEQTFGHRVGTEGGTFQQLFELEGSGYNVNGDANLNLISGQTIRWARGGQGRNFSSREADNSDNYDHMVTYQILDAPDGAPADDLTWLVFWEDKYLHEPSDLDYNDLVVEIKANVIPEPAGLSLLAIGVLGLSRRRA
jgi:hypothetical protein